MKADIQCDCALDQLGGRGPAGREGRRTREDVAGHSGRLTQGLLGRQMTPGLQDTDVQRVLRFNLIMTGDIVFDND